MKHSNLLKAVEKYSTVYVDKRINWAAFSAECWGQIISWHIDQYNDDVHCLRVRSEGDKDDIYSDYCAGSLYYTIKSALYAFTWELNKKVI